MTYPWCASWCQSSSRCDDSRALLAYGFYRFHRDFGCFFDGWLTPGVHAGVSSSRFAAEVHCCSFVCFAHGFYGAFLKDDLPLVCKLVSELVKVRQL